MGSDPRGSRRGSGQIRMPPSPPTRASALPITCGSVTAAGDAGAVVGPSVIGHRNAVCLHMTWLWAADLEDCCQAEVVAESVGFLCQRLALTAGQQRAEDNLDEYLCVSCGPSPPGGEGAFDGHQCVVRRLACVPDPPSGASRVEQACAVLQVLVVGLQEVYDRRRVSGGGALSTPPRNMRSPAAARSSRSPARSTARRASASARVAQPARSSSVLGRRPVTKRTASSVSASSRSLAATASSSSA